MPPLLGTTLLLVGSLAMATDPAYRAEVEKWRAERESRLRAEDGWLSLVGLFWLREGPNWAGSGPGNDIQLPRSAPKRVGAFLLQGNEVLFRAEPGATVFLEDRPVTAVKLQPDVPGPADILRVGDLSLLVIKRGRRYGIRVRDKNSEFRRNFRGCQWFPVDSAYRVQAKFVPYEPPRRVPILNILGDTEYHQSPGYVEFRVAGKQVRLEPVLDNGRLWFLFKDQTSGRETYGAGRFLYADLPQNGAVMLDFNKAYNPPCAFNPYTTCPLPPKQNHLPVPIRAGEKYDGRTS
ncbi:MAG: DUF1684 domain-containing protein [Bryobacteraceae bacterium]|nr:DUF1684 domain-containing protein [Bryobacteraceae bacterium]